MPEMMAAHGHAFVAPSVPPSGSMNEHTHRSKVELQWTNSGLFLFTRIFQSKSGKPQIALPLTLTKGSHPNFLSTQYWTVK